MQIYILQDVYEYPIPDVPTNKTDIINWEIEDPKEQRWIKPIVPEKFDSARDEQEFWTIQIERLFNGIWFWNYNPKLGKSEAIYITGAHYEYLTFWNVEYEIQFWHMDKEYFYFDDYVERDEAAFGKIVFKGRRGGITAKEIFLAIRKLKSDNHMKIGLISTKQEVARDTMLIPMRDGLASYNPRLRPIFKTKSGGELLQTEISLSSGKQSEITQCLKGWVKTKATIATAFDAYKCHKILFDEFLKWEGVDPMAIIEPQLKTMREMHNGNIIGKASLFSTMGTDPTKMKRAIAKAQPLWEGSNPEKKSENGRTATGFLRYFIGVYDYMGIDKYGYADKERAEIEYEQELQSKIDEFGEGSKEHIDELKALPRTIDDIFETPQQFSAFNRDGRVSKQKRKILTTPLAERGYVCGKFMRDIKTNKSYFNTSSEYENFGWCIKGLHIKNPQNIRKDYEGFYIPPRTYEGAGGYDPVRMDKEDTISQNISNAAILLFKKYDHYSENGIMNEFVGEYFGRQDSNDDDHEQFALACEYFGFLMCPESNVGVNYFKKRGYGKMTYTSPYDGGKGVRVHANTEKNNPVRDGMELIANYIKKPQEGEIDYLKTIVFPNTLTQLESFTKDKLRSHDLIAAMIQCFLAAQSLSPTVVGNRGASALVNAFYPMA